MNIQKHYESVEKFNSIADNLNNVTIDKLKAQMKVVVEEIGELQDAFDNKDAVELLDGACDGFVTLMGLIQQMQAAGFNVNKAIERVCENNLTKFPNEIDACGDQHYAEQGWNIFQNFEYDCYVLKDKNGKIRKPLNFKAVDISDLVPENFFKPGNNAG